MTVQPIAVPGLLPDGLEQAWHARTVELPGGHLAWTGRLAHRATHGTPTLRYRGHDYSAARIAYIIRHDVEPVGPVRAECDMRHCVAPDHVDDTVRRVQVRCALRSVLGVRSLPQLCVAGHDQSVDGRLHATGKSYCQRCKTVRKSR